MNDGPAARAQDQAQSQDPAQDPAVAKRIGPVVGLGLLAGPLLSMIDSSIVNVAVPDIAGELGGSVGAAGPGGSVQWIVSGYLLSLGVALSVTAFLARRFGTIRVYVVALTAFVLMSAACALAPTLGWLIVFRVVQGAVGAPLIPLALSVLLGGKGVGASGRIPISAALVLFVAPALGPTIGGALIGAGGWRWIFLVNVPIGLVGLMLVVMLPRGIGTIGDRSARVDLGGLVLLAGGVASVLFGVVEGAARGWGDPVAVSALLVGVLLLAWYALHARRSAHPVLDLRVIRSRNGALAMGLQTVCSAIAFATLFVVPVFTQGVQGHSAFATGLALLPQGVVMGLGTMLGQRLADRIPLARLVTGGFLLLAVTSTALVFLHPQTPLWLTALLLVGRAGAIGLVTTPLLRAILQPLADDQLADGNTVFTITQRLGGSLGVGVFASLLVINGAEADVLASFRLVGLVLVSLSILAAVASLFLRPAVRPGQGENRSG